MSQDGSARAAARARIHTELDRLMPAQQALTLALGIAITATGASLGSWLGLLVGTTGLLVASVAVGALATHRAVWHHHDSASLERLHREVRTGVLLRLLALGAVVAIAVALQP